MRNLGFWLLTLAGLLLLGTIGVYTAPSLDSYVGEIPAILMRTGFGMTCGYLWAHYAMKWGIL